MKDISGRFRKTLILTFLICILLLFLSYIFIYLFSAAGRVESVQEEQGSAVSSVKAEDILQSSEDETSYENEYSAVESYDHPSGEEPSSHPSDASQPAGGMTDPQDIVPPASEEKETSVSAGSEADSDDILTAEETDITASADALQDDSSRDSMHSSENVSVPQPPSILYAFAYETEVIITGSDEPVYDDDFFASFYVQGQDTLEYDDGLYYFMFYVDGETMGNLEIEFRGSQRLMNVSELKMYLGDLLTDDAYARLLESTAGDYVSVEHFRENGVIVEYDEGAFTINMIFSVDDMPERIISLSSSSYSRRNYALSGALELEPDFFSWRTSYNLYASFDWMRGRDDFGYSLSLSTSNYLTLGPVNLDFFYSLSYRNGEFSFNWNNYRFFYDFVEPSIRLSWGNVYGFGLSPGGTPLGIQFEKNYSFGTDSSPYNSHRESVTVTEESLLQVVRNGNVVFSRTLQPGNYRLEDFTFDYGYNEIEIVVTPTRYIPDDLDVSSAEGRAQLTDVSYHYFFDMAYDSQLLAEGETLFGGSLSFRRDQIDVGNEAEATGLLLRVSPAYYYDYHFDDFAVSWYQDAGLTDELTLMSEFSVSSRNSSGEKISSADISLALRGASRFGTTTITAETRMDTSDDAGYFPYFYTRLDHSFLIDHPLFRGLSTSLSYSTDYSHERQERSDLLTMRLSFSGSMGLLRYSMSGNISIIDYDFRQPEWRVSASLGMSPFRNFSVSAGLTLSQGDWQEPMAVSGYLSASISFSGHGSASYSTDFTGNHSLSGNLTAGSRDSLSFSLSGFDFSSPLDHSLSGGWFHSGDLYSLSVRASAYDQYRRYSTSVSFNTATFFSGGVFGFSRSVRDNFILIRPQGSLKGADVQVARSNQGSPQQIRRLFGTSVYTSLNSYQRNNLVVYLTGDDEFAETQTFSYEINPSNRSGYSIKINVPQEYTVTGIISFDGELQTTFSSPVYRVTAEEDGSFELVSDIELYLFADQDGRFIISGVEPGSYVFDVNYDDAWYAVCFSVDELEDEELRVVDFGLIDISSSDGDLAVFADSDALYPDYLTEYYDGVKMLESVRILDSATFWNELFPPLSDAEIIEDFSQGA